MVFFFFKITPIFKQFCQLTTFQTIQETNISNPIDSSLLQQIEFQRLEFHTERGAKKPSKHKEKNLARMEREEQRKTQQAKKKTQQCTWIRRRRAKKNPATHGRRGRPSLLKYISQILLLLRLDPSSFFFFFTLFFTLFSLILLHFFTLCSLLLSLSSFYTPSFSSMELESQRLEFHMNCHRNRVFDTRVTTMNSNLIDSRCQFPKQFEKDANKRNCLKIGVFLKKNPTKDK